MNLNEIKTFISVVEFQSYTLAAKSLGLPKSTISKQITKLERSLGIPLLYRTTRQLELTAAGAVYYKKCSSLIHELEFINTETLNSSENISGLIRLTAPEDLAIMFLPKILKDFTSIHHNIKFEVYLSNRMVNLIKEPIDLAIRVGKLKDSTLKAKKFGDLYNILVASPDFIQKQQATLNHIDCINHVPTIGFGELGQIRSWVLIHQNKRMEITPNCTYFCNHMGLIKEMVIAGNGIAFLPQLIVQNELKSGKLIHLFPLWHSPLIPIHLVIPPQKEIPKKLKTFMDFVSINFLQNSLQL